MFQRYAGFVILCAAVVLPLGACKVSPDKKVENNQPGLSGFETEAALDSFAQKLAKADAEAALSEVVSAIDLTQYGAADIEAPADMPSGSEPEQITAADAVSEDSAADASAESITNTQEAGVDEGGIVKNAGDYLVVLRRGRIFTIKTGGNGLERIDQIDAFPPDKKNPGQTWYDELLVHDAQIIVIGYSYGDSGTEVNRFDLATDGKLQYRDTYYLDSGDYYSLSNYASRLVGDELIFYAPVWVEWDKWRESLPVVRKRGEETAEVPSIRPENLYVAEPYHSAQYPLNMLHTVTRCKLSKQAFDCEASAIAGTWSHAFYVSSKAIYVWTEKASFYDDDEEEHSTAGQLFMYRQRLFMSGPRKLVSMMMTRKSTAQPVSFIACRLMAASRARLP